MNCPECGIKHRDVNGAHNCNFKLAESVMLAGEFIWPALRERQKKMREYMSKLMGGNWFNK